MVEVAQFGYAVVGVVYGFLAAAAIHRAAAGLWERKKIQENRAEALLWQSFLGTFKNRPFLVSLR